MPQTPTTPITVPLSTLQTGLPITTLESAFGPSSLGILIISHLPPHFPPLRHKLLTYISHLSRLPPTTLTSLTSPRSKYLVGWSHGVETLPGKGTPDYNKGSFYVNCAFYQDPSLQAAPPTPRFPHFPEYTEQNVWPPEDLMPGFRETVLQVVTLLVDVAALVARCVDGYAVSEIEGYRAGTLERIVRGSYTTKARLLHYFPPEATADSARNSTQDSTQDSAEKAAEKAAQEAKQDAKQEASASSDDWCATHLDHGCLTGLLSAMYIKPPLPALPDLPEPIPCPDESAGLWIRSRTGEDVRVSFPDDCIAFQTGEALEKITGGRFRAVPHYVSPGREGRMKGVERNTLAVFTQPNLEDVVDRETGECFGGFARDVVGRNTVG